MLIYSKIRVAIRPVTANIEATANKDFMSKQNYRKQGLAVNINMEGKHKNVRTRQMFRVITYY